MKKIFFLYLLTIFSALYAGGKSTKNTIESESQSGLNEFNLNDFDLAFANIDEEQKNDTPLEKREPTSEAFTLDISQADLDELAKQVAEEIDSASPDHRISSDHRKSSDEQQGSSTTVSDHQSSPEKRDTIVSNDSTHSNSPPRFSPEQSTSDHIITLKKEDVSGKLPLTESTSDPVLSKPTAAEPASYEETKSPAPAKSSAATIAQESIYLRCETSVQDIEFSNRSRDTKGVLHQSGFDDAAIARELLTTYINEQQKRGSTCSVLKAENVHNITVFEKVFIPVFRTLIDKTRFNKKQTDFRKKIADQIVLERVADTIRNSINTNTSITLSSDTGQAYAPLMDVLATFMEIIRGYKLEKTMGYALIKYIKKSDDLKSELEKAPFMNVRGFEQRLKEEGFNLSYVPQENELNNFSNNGKSHAVTVDPSGPSAATVAQTPRSSGSMIKRERSSTIANTPGFKKPINIQREGSSTVHTWEPESNTYSIVKDLLKDYLTTDADVRVIRCHNKHAFDLFMTLLEQLVAQKKNDELRATTTPQEMVINQLILRLTSGLKNPDITDKMQTLVDLTSLIQECRLHEPFGRVIICYLIKQARVAQELATWYEKNKNNEQPLPFDLHQNLFNFTGLSDILDQELRTYKFEHMPVVPTIDIPSKNSAASPAATPRTQSARDLLSSIGSGASKIGGSAIKGFSSGMSKILGRTAAKKA